MTVDDRRRLEAYDRAVDNMTDLYVSAQTFRERIEDIRHNSSGPTDGPSISTQEGTK